MTISHPVSPSHITSDVSKPKGFFARLGPGLITGASSDDPSGIATYSQAGAQFGYVLCWVILLCYPLMCAIQEISARIGRVTGRGIAGNIRDHYPPLLLRLIVGLLLIANIINIGADLGAMGAALTLLIKGPTGLYVIGFALFCVGMEVFATYGHYVAVLKWISFVLLAYVGVALVVHVPWNEVLYYTFLPHFYVTKDYVVTVVAVLGTTITPYCFFWQSSQEAEEINRDTAAHTSLESPLEAASEFKRIRFDTYMGMGYSNIISLFIIVCAAATLHAHEITNIQTSSQAAEALRPIAGAFTFVLFAIGIIGIGLLAVPVLAGSGAYALGEALGWPIGLDRKPQEAKAFYGTIAVSTFIGILINFVGIDPIKALFWSAVINGIVAVPLMTVIMFMARRLDMIGFCILSKPLWIMGWLCVFVMAAAVLIMFATS